MSILETNTVDAISIPKIDDNSVMLTIVDHLPWDDEKEHMFLLQEKVNAYLRFIESGEIDSAYPKAVGRRREISITGKYPLTDNAEIFYGNMRDFLKSAGLKLTFDLVED